MIKKKIIVFFFKLYPKKVSEDLIIEHDSELWTDKKGGNLVEITTTNSFLGRVVNSTLKFVVN